MLGGLKRRMQAWLEIVPAQEEYITIERLHTRQTEVLRSQLWYRGDPGELYQFFHALRDTGGSFWGTAPASGIRRLHSGLPAIIADTLSYLVTSDMDTVTAPEEWDEIAEAIDLPSLVGRAVTDTLVSGDGAFRISVNTDISPFPMCEFISGDRVELQGETVIIRTACTARHSRYTLEETYLPGRVESRLYDSSGRETELWRVPELSETEPVTLIDKGLMLAVPMRFYASQKYPGRGRPIFDGGRSDCLDALDEVISQWIDALRSGRVQRYIPLSLIPRDPENGSLKRVDSFGTEFIAVQGTFDESGGDRIQTVQPDIRYEAFVSSYSSVLLMCLQGLVSPATLGIDVGRMSSAEAQREKKDVTGITRNTITSVLERVLPKLIRTLLDTYAVMSGGEASDESISVSFGEYAAPDFDSRTETVGRAAMYGIMSVKTQVDELWGSSKDEDWRAEETARIMAEKGLIEPPPMPGFDE